MKKSTLCALALALCVPFTAYADWTKTVTDKKSFVEAWNSLEGAGNRNTIICDWEGVVNIGQVTVPTGGKIVVTSNKTEYDQMPQLQAGINGQAMQDNNDLSLFFSNISLQYRSGNTATSGQIFYWNKVYCPIDSFVVKNCEITNIARSFYRSVPAKDSIDTDNDGILDAEGDYKDGSIINYFEMSDCKVHKNMITEGNNWPLIYFGQTPKYVTIKDNVFFDMPYCKYLFQMSYITDPTGLGINTDFIFENNIVAIGAGGATQPFQLLNPGNYLGPQSKYFINNNVLAVPTFESQYVTVDSTGTRKPKILSAAYGMVIGKNNVIDGYSDWTAGNIKDAETGEHTWLYADTVGNYTAADVNLTWDETETFASPISGDYSILKSNPMYTMGAEYDKVTTMPTGTVLPIGPAWAYVDEFKVKAQINVAIEGCPFVTYTITPEKEIYYKGDEITVTLDAHNSYYRTLTSFKGWEDGSTNLARTLTIAETVTNLKATFEEVVDYISVFDFPGFSGNGNLSSYEADMYYDNNASYKAVLKVATWDSELQSYKDSVMQTRAGKFAEQEDATQRMNIVSRRTPKDDKLAGKLNYIYMLMSTKGFADIKVSSYVGTDNCANTVQTLEYSLDSLTWTKFAEVTLEEYMKWYELAGTLPADANDQDSVYVRWIGDATSDPIVHPITTWDAGDGFEYTGNILVTYGRTAETQYPKYVWFPSPLYTITPGQVEEAVPGITLKFGTEAETSKEWSVGTCSENMGGYEVGGYVKGNNGNPKPYGIDKVPTEGTFYTFTTTEAGELTVFVSLNANKNFYFYSSDGVAFNDYDGTYKVAEKYNGAMPTVSLEAGKSYYLYCSGSKLGLYGFEYKTASGIENVTIAQPELDINAPIYDLTGRQVAHPTKGVYLQNGYKFIVK